MPQLFCPEKLAKTTHRINPNHDLYKWLARDTVQRLEPIKIRHTSHIYHDLHKQNDLPKFLNTLANTIGKDSVFIGSLVGGGTAQELGHVLQQVDQEFYGGTYPRMQPNITLKSAASLLQSAGLVMPVADITHQIIHYKTIKTLYADLAATGNRNCLLHYQPPFTSRDYWRCVTDLYQSQYSTDGLLRMTLDIIHLQGWGR